MKSEAHFFKSSRFAAESNEDRETNPGRYGKQLAEWLMDRLQGKNWIPVEVIPEDWGRCLIIHYQPYLLWVACSNVRPVADDSSKDRDEPHVPAPDEIVWSTFVGRDLYPWNINFWRRSKADEEFRRLDADLRDILDADASIELMAH